jgi:hypothetical protein
MLVLPKAPALRSGWRFHSEVFGFSLDRFCDLRRSSSPINMTNSSPQKTAIENGSFIVTLLPLGQLLGFDSIVTMCGRYGGFCGYGAA